VSPDEVVLVEKEEALFVSLGVGAPYIPFGRSTLMKRVEVTEPALIIRIAKLYNGRMLDDELAINPILYVNA
jgi:hypothetical protein